MQSDVYAMVQGKPMVTLPKDLYIPPDALEIFLEAFTGPLDLLLYLIKKQNIDILNIPIAAITRQYMQYIEMMQEMQIELAAEYLVMASTLAAIKSRMLLPKPRVEDEEEDPRAELVRRLQEYERYRKAAEEIDTLPRINREIFIAQAKTTTIQAPKPLPEVNLQDLWYALTEVLERANMYEDHQVQREKLSTRAKMAQILVKLQAHQFTDFADLFTVQEGRIGVIVTFAALLELLRQGMIDIVQTKAFGKIHVSKK